MYNMFRRFSSCRKPSRACGWPISKCRRCTREVVDINEITYDEVLERIKQGAILIDTRTKQEFLEGHLEGAILIPYYEISRKVQNIIPNKDQTIIVYCQNGGRSIKAGDTLKRFGYNNIYNLKDGIEGIS